MRLIDADELEELFRETIGHISKEPKITKDLEHMIRASAMTIQMIKDMPTIQIPEPYKETDTESSIDEDIKILQATKLMFLGNDGQPISDLYEAIENGIEAIIFYRSIVKCKDCKYFEYNTMTNYEGIPLITGHEVCMKWAGGCKSNENGFCFMGERRANE